MEQPKRHPKVRYLCDTTFGDLDVDLWGDEHEDYVDIQDCTLKDTDISLWSLVSSRQIDTWEHEIYWKLKDSPYGENDDFVANSNL